MRCTSFRLVIKVLIGGLARRSSFFGDLALPLSFRFAVRHRAGHAQQVGV